MRTPSQTTAIILGAVIVVVAVGGYLLQHPASTASQPTADQTPTQTPAPAADPRTQAQNDARARLLTLSQNIAAFNQRVLAAKLINVKTWKTMVNELNASYMKAQTPVNALLTASDSAWNQAQITANSAMDSVQNNIDSDNDALDRYLGLQTK